MPDPFRKWAQGDEFAPSAAQLNAWTDAARFAQQSLNARAPVAPIGGQHFTPLRMRNNTGDVIPPLGVVGFSEPMVLPSVSEARFIHDLIVDAELPSDPLDRFAISLQQVPDGALFIAAIGGVVPCRVIGEGENVIAIDGDNEKLQAGLAGHPLLWSEDGEEERFGLVHIFGVSGCAMSYDLRLLWNPTAADLTISVRFNSVTEVISLDENFEADDIKTAVDAHSEFVAASVECTVEGAGPLWSSNVLLTLPAGATIVAHTATMTRRDLAPSPEWRVDICSCAVG